MHKILITGANGFVGSRLIEVLHRINEYELVGSVRELNGYLNAREKLQYVTGHLTADFDWTVALEGCDTVIHTAARVHIMDEKSKNPLNEFRLANVVATVNLAKQAQAAGIKRFIYLSSIKVNGEFSEPGCPFKEDDLPAPIDPYGVSKYEAEQALFKFGRDSGLEIVIIRPPLIYGPGVKANFAALMRVISKKIPLPLGAINNKRSLLALDNLIDLIRVCIHHPSAANQIYLAADGEDLSTTELLHCMAKSLDLGAILAPVPVWVLKLVLSALGKGDVGRRLCSSLQVDISKARNELGWTPPLSVKAALLCMVEDFKKGK